MPINDPYLPFLLQRKLLFSMKCQFCHLAGHVVNVVVLLLPLRHIVTLYLHILAALLLYMGHQISK